MKQKKTKVGKKSSRTTEQIEKTAKRTFALIDKKAVLITITEILLLLIMIASIMLPFVEKSFFYPIQLVLGLLFIGSLAKTIQVSADKKRFLLFFGILFALIEAMWLSQALIPSREIGNNVTMALFVLIVFFVFLFKGFFSKKTIEAKIVSSAKQKTIVEIETDFFSGMKKGLHEIKTNKKYSIGKKVTVKIKQGFFKKKLDRILE